MRWGLLLLIAAALAGCASKQAQVSTAPPAPIYDDAVPAALVYDPPVAGGWPRLEVSRDGRSMSAVAGFEDLITTFYYLRQDDYQRQDGHFHHHGGGNNDRFEREAITERFGVSYR